MIQQVAAILKTVVRCILVPVGWAAARGGLPVDRGSADNVANVSFAGMLQTVPMGLLLVNRSSAGLVALVDMVSMSRAVVD